MRVVAALAVSVLANAIGFGWALSSDMLRALHDRDRVRKVAVASLTQDDWETNREVRPDPKPRPPRAKPEERQAIPKPPPPSERAAPARPPVAAAPAPQPEPPAPPATQPAPPAPPPAAAKAQAPRPPPPRPPDAQAAPVPPPEPPAPLVRKEAARPKAKPEEANPPPASSKQPKVAGKSGVPEPPKEEPLQVVELGPDAGPEVEPDESRPVVLADRSSRASRNTVAGDRQKDAEAVASRPRPASEGKPGEPASGEDGEAERRVEGEQRGARGDEGEDGEDAGRGEELLAVAPDGEVPRAGDGEGLGRAGARNAGARVLGSREPDLRLSREAFARIARGPDVTIEGADRGDTTALNARRYGEARYIARVANLPNPYWEQEALANADAIRPFLDRPRVTEVLFRLDRHGHVSGLHVSETSGIEAIDRVALAVVRKAAPYPPLPVDLAAGGLTMRMRFRWEPQGLAGAAMPRAAP